MHNIGVVLALVCLMLCLKFHYTFPLKKEGTSRWSIFNIRNDSQHCNKDHYKNIIDRTKTMAAQIEHSISSLKNSHEENKKNKRLPKEIGSNEDLSHFEQMIIKKKNPYLDLKELELKYYSSKDTRDSVDPGHTGHNFREEPGICEPLEEGPNVEITNRGLSGFAIPTKLMKSFNGDESKTKLSENPSIDDHVRLSKKSKIPASISHEQLVASLKNDIRWFEKRME